MNDAESATLRVACDAMCGGVARWLRLLGVDAAYSAGIEDADLVRQAQAEQRLVISSDNKLFERRVFVSGEVPGLFVPVGMELTEQVRFVVKHLRPAFGEPRCTHCNGELDPVEREQVADVVPARSLVWARKFFRCKACRQVFWEGTHWRRIHALRGELEQALGSPPTQSRDSG